MTELLQPFDQPPSLIEQYLGLESMEVTGELLDLCGASIDMKAIPILKRRLCEEREQVSRHQARGYTRMREKSEQLVASLTALLEALEAQPYDPSGI